jgi:hypothetical protein
MNDPRLQLHCANGHAIASGADWCSECGEPPAAKPVSKRCRWCGGDCLRWGEETCPFRPRQIPRDAKEGR